LLPDCACVYAYAQGFVIGASQANANIGQAENSFLQARSPEQVIDSGGVVGNDAQQYLAVAQDGDVASVPSALSTGVGSAVGIAPLAVGGTFGSIQSTAGVIVQGSVSTTAEGASAAGFFDAAAFSQSAGALEVGTPLGRVFAILYVTAKGAYNPSVINGSAQSSGWAEAIVGDVIMSIGETPFESPVLTQQNVAQTLVGEDGRTALAIGVMNNLAGTDGFNVSAEARAEYTGGVGSGGAQ
jgi:hypothetical protein